MAVEHAMSEPLYRKSEEDGAHLRIGERLVNTFGDGVLFRCPCDQRVCYAAENHQITFDDDGVLTLDPSCGYAANSEHPQNWCHFWLRDGKVEMVGDSGCPGRDL